MAVAERDAEARVRLALRDDFPFYAENFLKVVHNQRVVPFELRPMQRRLWEVLAGQRAEGRPQRVIVLKARKLGCSTMAQGLFVQRSTQRANHNALTVAQDTGTAGELFGIGELMYGHLPADPELGLKPRVVFTRRGRELVFGEASRARRVQGEMGLNSRLRADTAQEFEAGRGYTFHSLHLSEAAFWPDLKRKLTGLLNTVPEGDPETLIVIESTANGHNHFRKLWLDAEEGRSDYVPFFAAWFEDPSYTRAFLSEEARGEFEASVGDGKWGEGEPELLQRGVSLEQLHWRRWAIENRCQSDLDLFRQEYPSTPDEAFIGSGSHVFSQVLVAKAREEAESFTPELVFLEAGKTTIKQGRHATWEVPVEVTERAFTGGRDDSYWKIWQRPEPNGQYVAAMDPASGEENTEGDTAWHAIQVIDHWTGVQCAQWHSRIDPGLAAMQLFLVALFYAQRPYRTLVVPEMTGGYGNLIAERVWRDLGWRNMYFRRPVDPQRRPHQSQLVGFSTDRGTKPRLEDGMKELLREGSHGIRSVELADEFRTYIRDPRGKTGPEPDRFSDLLMAYMIAQFVRQQRPPKHRKGASGVVSTAVRQVLNPTTGW